MSILCSRFLGGYEKCGGYKTIVYIICSIAALGGLLFSLDQLDQGFIANSLAFVAFFVPETKGITLEALENNLKKK